MSRGTKASYTDKQKRQTEHILETVQMVQACIIDPATILSQREPLTKVLEAYKQFDVRMRGWIKVSLKP